MKLQDYLSAFSVEDLRELATRRRIPLSPASMNGRQTLVRALASALDRSDTVYGAVVQLNQAQLAVLHAVLQAGKNAALSRICSQHGVEPAVVKEALEGLRLWGLLFPEGDWEHIVLPQGVRNAGSFLPGRRTEPLAELLRHPRLETVAAGKCAPRPGSFSRDLAEFLARVARSRFKLTQAGRMNRRDLKGMENALGVEDDGYSYFVYVLAAALGLLSRDPAGILAISEGADVLLGQPEPGRTGLISAAWLLMRGYPESASGDPTEYDYIPVQLAGQRAGFLSTLVTLPADEAVSVGSLTQSMIWTTPLAFQQWDASRDALRTVTRLARSLYWLGLAAVDVPKTPKAVLPTPLARRALQPELPGGPELIPDDPLFFLQPNAEAFAPPNLAPRTLLHLRRLTGEKKGAAEGTFPLTADSLRRAFDSGLTTAEVVTFLERHSRTGLPSNVRALVETAGRQHGRIRLIPAGYVLVTDEPQLLEELRRVKSVSSLVGEAITERVAQVADDEVPNLMRALRQRGYAPLNEAETGLSPGLPEDPEHVPPLPKPAAVPPSGLLAGLGGPALADIESAVLEQVLLGGALPGGFDEDDEADEIPSELLQPQYQRETIRQVLAYAAEQELVAAIQYENPPGTPPKELRLAVYDGNRDTVYGFCYESDSERTFDLKRIRMARLTGEQFEFEDEEDE